MNTATTDKPQNLLEKVRGTRDKVSNWLDSKSETYSKICEEHTTRRTVIRVNLISCAMIVSAICIEQKPFVSIVAMVCAGYMVYRLNASEKKG
jgi:hypothetical protein